MRIFCSLLITLLSGFWGCRVLLGDVIVFDDRIDSQEKTEIRHDVGGDRVVTGLGFRAAYDNITTMYCRSHRLGPDGTLTEPREVILGSEPNHACEAKVVLPDGWVAVGFGAAGEPEWDVTLLRIWARSLNPDGTLGEVKVFNDGFKPDREPEREIVLAEADRVLTGAGLRFASNDIGGIYARSKRILNLTDDAREKLRRFKTRAWVASGLLYSGLGSLADDLKSYGVTRLDITIPRMLSSLPSADKIESHVWVRTTDFADIQRTLGDGRRFTGVVVDLAEVPAPLQDADTLLELHKACRAANLRLSLRLDHRTYPLSAGNLALVGAMPEDTGLIVPLYEPRIFKRGDAPLDFTAFGRRDVIVELDLLRRSMGAGRIPDIRIDELPSLIVQSALAGAKGFIVQVNLLHRELLDGVNSLSLQALHRLADDPFGPTEPLWNEFCAARYGPAAERAASALKRTAAINDLIYRTFDYPLFWYNGTMHPLPEIDDRIRRFARTASSPQAAEALDDLIGPAGKTVERASREKQAALWLLQQSIRDANEACEIHAAPETRDLADAMGKLRCVSLFWHNATQAYLLTKLYAIDGAPVTRAGANGALKALDETADAMTTSNGLGLLRIGREAFTRTLRGSLEYCDENAALPSALRRVQALSERPQDDDAANELLKVILSPKFAPHLSRQNQLIGEISSSLGALGRVSPNLAVMRHGDGSWLIEKVAGRWSYQIGKDRPCLYLDFPAGPLPSSAEYIISFEYFDRGDWKLHFEYDSDYPPENKRQYHPVEPLQLTDTGRWKTGSFAMTKALFNSGQNMLADMRFVSGSTVCIRNIRLLPKRD